MKYEPRASVNVMYLNQHKALKRVCDLQQELLNSVTFSKQLVECLDHKP